MSGAAEKFLQGKQSLCIDSVAVIYFIEEDPAYLPVLSPIFERVDSGVLSVMSSFITLIEVLTKPLQLGRLDLAAAYRERLLRSNGFTLFPIEEIVSERASYLRARYGVRTPDAIQVATAIEHGAQSFLTNDNALSKIQEIEVVMLKDLI